MELLERIPMSWDDYLAMPELPRHEWVDGVVVVSPLASYAHQRICRRLANLWESSLPALHVFEGGNVRLPRNRVRIPDVVAFAVAEEGVFNQSTAVAVAEVLSPSTRAEDTMRKSGEYAEAGIGQYWVLDPELGRLDVFGNVDGEWEPMLHLDTEIPAGAVALGEYGDVLVELDAILG